MHTDRRKVISWSLGLSAAGDWERYAAGRSAKGTALENYLLAFSIKFL
jgi:hypothetical protein